MRAWGKRRFVRKAARRNQPFAGSDSTKRRLLLWNEDHVRIPNGLNLDPVCSSGTYSSWSLRASGCAKRRRYDVRHVVPDHRKRRYPLLFKTSPAGRPVEHHNKPTSSPTSCLNLCKSEMLKPLGYIFSDCWCLAIQLLWRRRFDTIR